MLDSFVLRLWFWRIPIFITCACTQCGPCFRTIATPERDVSRIFWEILVLRKFYFLYFSLLEFFFECLVRIELEIQYDCVYCVSRLVGNSFLNLFLFQGSMINVLCLKCDCLLIQLPIRHWVYLAGLPCMQSSVLLCKTDDE